MHVCILNTYASYRWLDQTFDAVVHWHSQIHVWWYFSAKLYATFWRKLAGVLLAFTHQGHFEYSGLQEWGDTKETLHCHLVYSVLWLPCAVVALCSPRCLETIPPTTPRTFYETQVLCTYLRTWFLFDISLISLDVMTIFTLSGNLRNLSSSI